MQKLKKIYNCFSHYKLWRKVRKLDAAAVVLWNSGEDEAFFVIDKISRPIWEQIHGEKMPDF